MYQTINLFNPARIQVLPDSSKDQVEIGTSASAPMEKRVAIGRVQSCSDGECLVAVLYSKAVDLAKTYSAIGAAEQWKDFRLAIGDSLWKEFLEHGRESGFEVPGDDVAFDPDEIPGFADGDWPTCPRNLARKWFPASVVQLAASHETVFNGEYLEFAVDRERELIAAFEESGFTITREDDLVKKACGMD